MGNDTKRYPGIWEDIIYAWLRRTAAGSSTLHIQISRRHTMASYHGIDGGTVYVCTSYLHFILRLVLSHPFLGIADMIGNHSQVAFAPDRPDSAAPGQASVVHRLG